MQTKRKLLNSQEAAEYLGLSLSYFRKMMMRRVIPMYKPSGKLCFFDPDDLDAYLKSVRISSQEEIDSEAERYLANNIKSQKLNIDFCNHLYINNLQRSKTQNITRT